MKASLQPKPMYCSRDYYYSSRIDVISDVHLSHSLKGHIVKWTTTRSTEDQTLMEMPSSVKKGLQAFLGNINYLSKFSPSMATVCEPLQKLALSRAVWTWNASY